MKFSKLFDEYQLPEWRGHYLRYRFLKKRLHDIAEGRGELALEQLVAGEASSATASQKRRRSSVGVLKGLPEDGPLMALLSNMSRTPDSPEPAEVWRCVVELEAVRICGRIDLGFEELCHKFAEVVAVAEGQQANTANGRFMELRVLQAVGNVAEGLARLRGYAELNHAALYKILKKHDKLLSDTVGIRELYPRLVEAASIADMPRFDRLDEQIKKTFLRSTPCQGLEASPEVARLAAGLGNGREENLVMRGERMLFFFLGCSSALLLAIFVLIALPAKDPQTFSMPYFLSSFCVFRLVFMVLLSMWGAGTVARVCEDHSINHLFLLGVDPRCRVGPSFLFSRAAFLTSLWILIFGMYVVDYKWMVVPQAHDEHDEGFNSRASFHYVLYPVIILGLTVGLALSPSRICRFRYRGSIVRSICRTICAPFFAVSFCDNIIGDVMTSLAKPMQDIAPAICYLGMHHPQTKEDVDLFLKTNNVCPAWQSLWVAPFVAGLPFVFRLLQCARRYYDTKEPKHLMNLGKYAASLLVVIVSRVFGSKAFAVVVVSCIATTYSATWDVFMDWGLGFEELIMMAGLKEGENATAREPRLLAVTTDGGVERAVSSPGAPDQSKQPFIGDSPSHAAQAPRTMSDPCVQRTSIANAQRAGIANTLQRPGHSPPRPAAAAVARRRHFSRRVYWTAVILDILLRLTWVITLMPATLLTNDIVVRSLIQMTVSSAEIMRRTFWTVLRLEWEQVSNASGYRALLWVPLKMANPQELHFSLELPADYENELLMRRATTIQSKQETA